MTAVRDEYDAVRRVVSGAVAGAYWEEDKTPTNLTIAFQDFVTRDHGGTLRFAVTYALNMGGVAAADAASPLLLHYRPRVLAMSGVCAGRRGKVQLGDVIIADRLWCYDTGKLVRRRDEQGNEVEDVFGDPYQYQVPAHWKQDLEAFGSRLGEYFPAATESWLGCRPRTYEQQEEWLFRRLSSGDAHPLNDPDREARCADYNKVVQSLQARGVVERAPLRLTEAGRRMAQEGTDLLPDPDISFRVHVAPIGSGSCVVEDEKIFDRLAETMRKVLGLEMEAAAIGAVAHHADVPILVMKGVQDFADPRKNDNFREFAARASAECLIAFLRGHLPSGRTAGEVLSPGTSSRRPQAKNPGTLLAARFEVVPFIPEIRTAELAELRSWCAAPVPTSARLFVGAGGSGKTRLLTHWAQELRKQGWHAGFLPDAATEDDERLVLTSPLPTLVVVDYAETRRPLTRFLAAAASRGSNPAVGRAALRVVLLAREVGDWWLGLCQHSTALSDLLGSYEPWALRPVEVEGPRRRDVCRRSGAALGAVLGKLFLDPPLDLSDPIFGRALYLEMAALASLEGLPLTGGSLLGDIVEHERRYWARSYQSQHRDALDEIDFKDSVARLMAGITLRGGVASHQEAESLNEGVAGPPAGRYPHVLRLLRGLYSSPVEDPREAYIGRLEPDLLGERLVLDILTHAETAPGFLTQAFRGTDGGALRNGFAVLGRLSLRVDESRAQEWIGQVLADDVSGRAEAAFDAALSLGRETAHAPLGRALHAALAREGTIAIARSLEPRLPMETVSLREVGAWVTEEMLKGISTIAETVSERARLLNNLGNRLRELGRREEALAATDEAVQHYRKLAAARPDAFLPDLATSLNNLGAVLSGLGRREEALAATNEAAQLRRKRAATG